MNLSSLIARGELSLTSEAADDNPDLHPDEIPEECEHYLCAMRGRTHEIEFHYTCGTGEGPPKVQDALRYLGSVAVEFESCDDMLDWASEYDLDPGDVHTREAYEAIARMTRELWRLVGDDMYDELRRGIEIEQAVDIAWSAFDRYRLG